MQDDKTLASRMAHAFADTILESKGEEAAKKIKGELRDALQLNQGELGAFFQSPVFTVEEKTQVLNSVLAKGAVEPELARFLTLLVELREMHLLPEILGAYEELERGRRNEVRATVRSAFPLDATELKRLADALGRATGKKVLVDVEEDPSLIGGVVAQVGSVVYDASIRGFLNRMQQEF